MVILGIMRLTGPFMHIPGAELMRLNHPVHYVYALPGCRINALEASSHGNPRSAMESS